MAALDQEGSCTPTVQPAECPVLAQITPAKSSGYLFNSQAYKTPTGRPHLLQQFSGLHSPRSFTPGTMRSGSSSSSSSRSISSQGTTPGSRQYTPGGLRTPRGLSTRKYTPSPMARDLALQLTPKYMTPKGNIMYNPFETGLLDNLGRPLLSPNVFAQTSTPNSEDGSGKPFRWSIEHLAELQPVDIEEIPQHNFHSPEFDLETEQKAQQAIEAFFSKSCVVPSPWSDTSQRKTGFHLPQTPSTPDVFSPAAYMMAKAAREQVQAAVAALDDDYHDVEMTQDVGCQTALSLPSNFDLEKLLGEHYSREQEIEQELEEKDLSSSSLRRKLFFQGDAGTPLSPVRGRRQTRRSMPMEYVCSSPNISPVRCHTPEDHRNFVTVTPGSADQFSSSPIGNKERYMSPCLRRCSTAPDLLMSPEMSPIMTSTERKTNSASSGNFTSPLCVPLRGTPSSGVPSGSRSSHPLNSLGISPIRLVGHNDSYRDLSVGQKRASGEKRKSPDTLHASPCLFSKSEGDAGSDNDMESRSSPHHRDGGPDLSGEFGMDFEGSPVQEEKRFAFSIGSDMVHRGNGLFASSTRADFTDLDPYSDPIDRSVDHVTTTSQDTGYNTNSLQISNPDVQYSGALGNLTQTQSSISGFNIMSQQNTSSTSMIAHTDLTAQFGNMPISGGPSMDVSEGYDSGDELGTSSGMNSYSKRSSSNSSLIIKEKFPPDPLCNIESEDEHIHVPPSVKSGGIASWDEDKILQRARQMLAKLDNPAETREVAKRMVRKTARKKYIRLETTCETPRNPAAMATPHRQQFQKLGIVPDDVQSKNIFASDVAFKVLQRAGDDVAKYCQNPMDNNAGSHLVRSTSMPENFSTLSPDL